MNEQSQEGLSYLAHTTSRHFLGMYDAIWFGSRLSDASRRRGCRPDRLGPRALTLRLSLDGQGRGRLGFQPPEVDWFSGILAVAIGAVVEPGQASLDLVQQNLSAFAVNNAEFSVHRRARLISLIALGFSDVSGGASLP